MRKLGLGLLIGLVNLSAVYSAHALVGSATQGLALPVATDALALTDLAGLEALAASVTGLATVPDLDALLSDPTSLVSEATTIVSDVTAGLPVDVPELPVSLPAGLPVVGAVPSLAGAGSLVPADLGSVVSTVTSTVPPLPVVGDVLGQAGGGLAVPEVCSALPVDPGDVVSGLLGTVTGGGLLGTVLGTADSLLADGSAAIAGTTGVSVLDSLASC